MNDVDLLQAIKAGFLDNKDAQAFRVGDRLYSRAEIDEALLAAMQSDTPAAADIRYEVITTWVAWRKASGQRSSPHGSH